MLHERPTYGYRRITNLVSYKRLAAELERPGEGVAFALDTCDLACFGTLGGINGETIGDLPLESMERTLRIRALARLGARSDKGTFSDGIQLEMLCESESKACCF